MKCDHKMRIPVQGLQHIKILCPVIAFNKDDAFLIDPPYCLCQFDIQLAQQVFGYMRVPAQQRFIQQIVSDDAIPVFVSFRNFIPQFIASGPVDFFFCPEPGFSVTVRDILGILRSRGPVHIPYNPHFKFCAPGHQTVQQGKSLFGIPVRRILRLAVTGL